MSGVYSPFGFFRRAPNAMLKIYFERRGVLANFDFETMTLKQEVGATVDEEKPQKKVKKGGEHSIDALRKAWLTLESDARENMELDFQEIAGLSTARGNTGLVRQAADKESLTDLFTSLELEGFCARAFWVFLERPQYWNDALRYDHVDSIADSKWRRRKEIAGGKSVDSSDIAITALQTELGSYFKFKESRGERCKVDYFTRTIKDKAGNDKEQHYFVANLEDYAQRDDEFSENRQTSELKSRLRRPAFEAIFMYCPTDDTLDISIKGGFKHLAQLQKSFAQIILGVELPKFVREKESYDLAALQLPSIDGVFAITADMGIESVFVKELRVSIAGGKETLLLDAGTESNKQAAFELLDKLKNALPMESFKLKSVNVVATFDESVAGSKERSFWISPPHSCGLGHTGQDEVLRQVLTAAGIQV